MTKKRACEIIQGLNKKDKNQIVQTRKVSTRRLGDLLCCICRKAKKLPTNVHRTADSIILRYSSQTETIDFEFKMVLNSKKVYVNIYTIRSDVVIEKESFWFLLDEDSDIVIDRALTKIQSLS